MSRLLGIGCDTEVIKRLEDLLVPGARMLDRWFTPGERTRILGETDRGAEMATRIFCLKEATIKALWTTLPLLPDAIEILELDESTGSARLALTRHELSGLRLEARFNRMGRSMEATVIALTSDPTDHPDSPAF